MPSCGKSAKLPGAALARSKPGRLKNIRACATQSACTRSRPTLRTRRTIPLRCREGRRVVVDADETLAARVLDARLAQNRAFAHPWDVARIDRKLEFDLLRHRHRPPCWERR